MGELGDARSKENGGSVDRKAMLMTYCLATRRSRCYHQLTPPASQHEDFLRIYFFFLFSFSFFFFLFSLFLRGGGGAGVGARGEWRGGGGVREGNIACAERNGQSAK